MRKQLLTVISAAVIGVSPFAFSTSASAADGGRPITVQMTGAAERPDPGDPDGSGTASFRINPGQRQLCYTLTVSNIAPATGAHIHIAPLTDAGPIVVHLTAPTNGTSSECITVDRRLALDLIKNPQDYYVNVHNAAFPRGAIRGQLG